MVIQNHWQSSILVRFVSLVDVILNRGSIRRYEQKKIPKNVLDKILEADRQALLAMNRQPWHFIVLTDSQIKKELAKGLFNRHVKDSPVTIVGCASTGLIDRTWSIIDTSIALQNMVIAAWAMGVGPCWIGDFKEDKFKKLLKIPSKWKIVALVSFGYPAQNPKPRRKKTLEEIVRFNRF
jgi:nitroreductase